MPVCAPGNSTIAREIMVEDLGCGYARDREDKRIWHEVRHL